VQKDKLGFRKGGREGENEKGRKGARGREKERGER
jgi:hypothetical protein